MVGEVMYMSMSMYIFFFNDTATTEIYTLSLHDALPIWESLKPSVPKQKNIGTTHFLIGNPWNLQFLYRITLEQPIYK